MEYKVQLKVDGAVSHGLGISYPDVYTKEEIVQADDNERAVVEAICYALSIAESALHNPDNGYVIVTLENIFQQGSDKPIEQFEILKKLRLDDKLNDKGNLQARCGLIDKALLGGGEHFPEHLENVKKDLYSRLN